MAIRSNAMQMALRRLNVQLASRRFSVLLAVAALLVLDVLLHMPHLSREWTAPSTFELRAPRVAAADAAPNASNEAAAEQTQSGGAERNETEQVDADDERGATEADTKLKDTLAGEKRETTGSKAEREKKRGSERREEGRGWGSQGTKRTMGAGLARHKASKWDGTHSFEKPDNGDGGSGNRRA